MKVKTKEEAVKTGMNLADQGKLVGLISKNSEIQRAAEAAHKQRMEEINRPKRPN